MAHPLIAAATSSYPGLPGRDARPQLVGVLAAVVRFFTGSLGYTRELPAIGDNPPSDDLRKALDAWFGSAERETGDWVVVYYTGHADVVGDESLYLLGEGDAGLGAAGADEKRRKSRRLWEAVKANSGMDIDMAEVGALWLGLFLLFLLQAAVGAANTMLSVSLSVISSETPPGEWRHVQSIWSADPEASLLSHSQIYDDKYVIESLAKWIAEGWSDQANQPVEVVVQPVSAVSTGSAEQPRQSGESM